MKKKLIISALTTFLFCTMLFAQSGLSLIDHSIEFNGSSRREITRFVNRSQDTLRFNISLVSCYMDRDGELVQNSDSINEYEASTYLRIYPRTVTVPPGELQSVAVQLQANIDLEPGEYRSHLLFEPLIDDGSDNDIIDATDENEMRAQVRMLSAVSIPVSILVKDLTIDAEIKKVKIIQKNGTPSLAIRIERSGNRSLRGFFDFKHVPENGEPMLLQPKSITIYRELKSRDIFFDISALPRTGVLHITLKTTGPDGDYVVFDAKEIAL